MRTQVASSKAFVRGVAVRARTTSARRAQRVVTMAKVCVDSDSPVVLIIFNIHNGRNVDHMIGYLSLLAACWNLERAAPTPSVVAGCFHVLASQGKW